MRKVLVTSPRGRTLVAFGWIDVRVVDEGGVRACARASRQLQQVVREDPSLMDFYDCSFPYDKAKPV